METKLANKLLRCGRQWECDPLFIPHGMAQSPTKISEKFVGTCGRAVSVGGVIQFTDHVGKGGQQIFSKKYVGAG